MANSFDEKLIKELRQIPVYANIPGLSLASLEEMKCPFYVPVDTHVLETEFCPGLKWKKIIKTTNSPRVEIDGIDFIPVRITILKMEGKRVILGIYYVLEKGRREIVVYNNSVFKNESVRSYQKFNFNNFEFDISAIKKNLPSMQTQAISSYRSLVSNSLKKICLVDYIVTDTNCWCSVARDGGLMYETVLKRMSNYILNHNLPTKFLVSTEIMAELKRLCRKNKGACAAQQLLHNYFVPKHLIYNPNPDEEVDSQVFADPTIRAEVKKQYLKKKALSFITNDQELMMKTHCLITNISREDLIPPNFISLKHISQLFELWDMLKKFSN